MNNYRLMLIIDGTQHCQSFSAGNNAIEAFEKAFKEGVIQFPCKIPVKVIATNTVNDLSVEFKVQIDD